MRKIIFAALVVMILAGTKTMAQTHAKPKYITVADTETVVLKGYINRSVLEGDTAFKWFDENMKYGTADEAAVKAFKNNATKFDVVVFGGTWCHDTQNLLPVFYRLVNKSGYPENKITLIALDRAKTGPDDVTKTYNVTNVPTFIILHDGKEVGRVVEYGKTGEIDKELGEIVTKEMGK